MGIISRQAWGADNVSFSNINLPVSTVFIHHTATKASSDGARDMRNIESGEQAVGYSTIAYHACGSPDGKVYAGRIDNNNNIKMGAATKNNNSTSLAYCFIGNFMNDKPTAQALESCAQTIASWVRSGAVKPNFSLRKHNEVFATACPGTNIISQMGFLKSRIDQILKGGSMSADALTEDEFNYLHILAHGGLPGKGYDGRYTGQPLTTVLHAWLGADPLKNDLTLAKQVKDGKLIKPSECPKVDAPPTAETPAPVVECKCECDVDNIAGAVFNRIKEQYDK